MSSINVTELRRHLPEYLKQMQAGEEIAITLRGKTNARIVPEAKESKREVVRKRLEALRGIAKVGDIISPINEEWTADADHL